jgi:hypothetical protein
VESSSVDFTFIRIECGLVEVCALMCLKVVDLIRNDWLVEAKLGCSCAVKVWALGLEKYFFVSGHLTDFTKIVQKKYFF